MSDLEQLKKRKEELMLEREVAKLERRKRLDKAAARWSWFWVAPLALVGGVLILLGLGEIHRIARSGEVLVILVLGTIGVIPLVFKLLSRR